MLAEARGGEAGLCARIGNQWLREVVPNAGSADAGHTNELVSALTDVVEATGEPPQLRWLRDAFRLDDC